MHATKWTRVLAAAVVTSTWACAGASAQVIRRPPVYGGEVRQDRGEYNQGYEQGYQRGQVDARKNRRFEAVPDGNGRLQRDPDFRQGFAAGYRAGFDQVSRDRGVRDERRDNREDRREDRREGVIIGQQVPGGYIGRQAQGGYQEPALARGYSDGYNLGAKDGRDRRKYDPVGQRDYREADQGYYGNYGSKDAYKNNYRAGFRQGYEDGYREGNYRR